MDLERQVAELAHRVAVLEAALMNVDAAPPGAEPEAQLAATVPAAAPGPAFLPVGSAQASIVASPQAPPPPLPNQQLSSQAPPPHPNQPQSANPPPPAGGSYDSQEHQPAAFEWGIESLLRWAGVILVSLAGIFLVSTAISRGWIGPELQLLGATLGGMALFAAAIHLADSRRPWALALGCGGAVVLAVCALATHEWLNVVGPGIALTMLAAVTVISTIVALEVRLEGVALVGAVVGLFAPLELLHDFGGGGAVLAWVVTFILGTSALGLVKTWPGVRLIVGWLGAVVLGAYAVIESVDGALLSMGVVSVVIVGATLWVGPTLAQRLAPTGPGSWGTFDWKALDFRLVAFVPAWVWAAVVGLLSPIETDDSGLVAIVVAFAFLSLSAVTWQHLNRIVSITTIFGSFALLAFGLALLLDGPALMVALAGQAATSYYLSSRLNNDSMLRIGSYLVGLITAALAGSEMLHALGNDGFANVGSGFATLLVVLCAIAATVLIHARDNGDPTFELPFIGAWIGVMLWLAAALLGAPQGLVLISVAWSAMACAGLIVGLTSRVSVLKNAALGTLAITLFKLVSVDMSEVDVFWRVGVFFVVGIGLITLGLKVPSLVRPQADVPEPGHSPDRNTTF